MPMERNATPEQPKHVTPLRHRLKTLTDALTDQWANKPEAQQYICCQWAEWVRLAHLVNMRSPRLFYAARWLTVVGATIVPTLVVIGAQTRGIVAAITQTSAVVLSLLVAAAAGALQVTQMGPRWRLYRRLQFDLERAGAQLYAKRGDYTIDDGCGSTEVSWLSCEDIGFAVFRVVDAFVLAAEVVRASSRRSLQWR